MTGIPDYMTNIVDYFASQTTEKHFKFLTDYAISPCFVPLVPEQVIHVCL